MEKTNIKLIDSNQSILSLTGKIIKVEDKNEYVIKVDEKDSFENEWELIGKFIYGNENEDTIDLLIKVKKSIFVFNYENSRNIDNKYRLKIYLFLHNNIDNKQIVTYLISSNNLNFTVDSLFKYTTKNYFELLSKIVICN